MQLNKKFVFLCAMLFVLASFFVAEKIIVRAEEIDPNAVAEMRRRLEEELRQLEGQIDGLGNTLDNLQGQKASLQRDLDILEAKINKAKLQIKARNITIGQLESGIYKKNGVIKTLDQKINDEKESLGELLRKTNESDSASLFEVVLGYQKMSDFFVDVDAISTIQEQIQVSFEEIRTTKKVTQEEKEDLESRRAEELELRSLQEMEKKSIEKDEAEKQKLMTATKGQEKVYQNLLAEKKKSIATIKSQLFSLSGSSAISFEKAVEYATLAWRQTGVRPAFLLGVIKEETNLGKNVGKGTWTVDMAHVKCTKQREAFLKITAELGLNPDSMPVSKKQSYGYCGGAMGPAQFMPTTWLLYKDKVSAITGNNPPSPWDPRDAFVASALLLKDNGGAGGNFTNERRAALKYLAGSNWNNKAYAFYGDAVMSFARDFQEQINIITGQS